MNQKVCINGVVDADMDKVVQALAESGLAGCLARRLHVDTGKHWGMLCEHLDMTGRGGDQDLALPGVGGCELGGHPFAGPREVALSQPGYRF